MLSRKYYKEIARIIRGLSRDMDYNERNREVIYKDELVDALVDYFKEDNYRFNPTRFRIACEEE